MAAPVVFPPLPPGVDASTVFLTNGVYLNGDGTLAGSVPREENTENMVDNLLVENNDLSVQLAAAQAEVARLKAVTTK